MQRAHVTLFPLIHRHRLRSRNPHPTHRLGLRPRRSGSHSSRHVDLRHWTHRSQHLAHHRGHHHVQYHQQHHRPRTSPTGRFQCPGRPLSALQLRNIPHPGRRLEHQRTILARTQTAGRRSRQQNHPCELLDRQFSQRDFPFVSATVGRHRYYRPRSRAHRRRDHRIRQRLPSRQFSRSRPLRFRRRVSGIQRRSTKHTHRVRNGRGHAHRRRHQLVRALYAGCDPHRLSPPRHRGFIWLPRGRRSESRRLFRPRLCASCRPRVQFDGP